LIHFGKSRLPGQHDLLRRDFDKRGSTAFGFLSLEGTLPKANYGVNESFRYWRVFRQKWSQGGWFFKKKKTIFILR